jgi:hypothetical protein
VRSSEGHTRCAMRRLLKVGEGLSILVLCAAQPDASPPAAEYRDWFVISG